MTGKHCVCSLCCHTLEEKDGVVIDESLRGMLQAVLIGIDLTTNPNTLICDNCHKKLEANYNFKRKCIFTEDSITPYVSENVKLNLKEIQNEIIKSEDMENDNNVCRLCLQFVDNDMTLSDSEKDQFQRFFPEIDLYRTNFVILCSTCYDHLHKYFVFVTLCLALDGQKSDNLYQLETKIDIEKEGISCKLENMEEHIEGIKKEVELLNEDLDIKCDTEDKDEDDERCDTNNLEVEQLPLMKKENLEIDTLSEKSIKEQGENTNHFDAYICRENIEKSITYFTGNTEFEFESKNDEQNQVLSVHTGDFKMTSANKHINYMHSDSSKITWYSCEQCDKIFEMKQGLQDHVSIVHTVSSKMSMPPCNKTFKSRCDLKYHVLNNPPRVLQCEECGKKYKQQHSLTAHMFVHAEPPKITWHQCKLCDYKFKYRSKLKRHLKRIHSVTAWYQCGWCDEKFKVKSNLRAHMLVHGDPPKIARHQCQQCDKKFKQMVNLRAHMLIHLGPSKTTRYQCEQCGKKFKLKANLSAHMLVHAEPSKIDRYQCEKCGKKCKRKGNLTAHMLIHPDPCNIGLYQCERCSKKYKGMAQLKAHMLVHTESSKITCYQCEWCDKKFKLKANLSAHMLVHAEPPKINCY